MNDDLHTSIAGYRDRIERYIATMVNDADVAGDLAQETMKNAVDKSGDLRDPDRLGPWIYTIAVNLVRQHLRRAVNQEQSLEFDPLSVRGSALSSIVRRESAEVLALAIDRLPILLREAFVLHVVEGLAFNDIQEITAASLEALHVRNHRAKGLLRKQLGSTVDTFWVE